MTPTLTAHIQLCIDRYPSWQVVGIENICRVGWPPEDPPVTTASRDNLQALGRQGYSWVVFRLRKGTKTRDSRPMEIFKLV